MMGRACRWPGCRAIVEFGIRPGFCPEHRGPADRARGSAVERGYDRRWHELSRAYLARHPCASGASRKAVRRRPRTPTISGPGGTAGPTPGPTCGRCAAPATGAGRRWSRAGGAGAERADRQSGGVA